MNVLSIRNLSKSFGQQQIIKRGAFLASLDKTVQEKQQQ